MRGKYRINAVAEMTGVPAATLRAWEKRYGLPEPSRTESAYRVYSENDVALVRRVRELCDGGMAPSEAAKLALADRDPVPADARPHDGYDTAAAAIVDAAAAFDPDALRDAVRHAIALGPATAVFDRALAPALVEIGRRWHAGELSVGQEHLASQVIEESAASMLRLIARERATRTAVVACFADDTHVLAALGISLHLASWDFRVVRLGPCTPPSAIAHAVQALSPALVGLSITIEPPAHRARELVDQYATACGDTPWIVGGSSAAALGELVRARGGEVAHEHEPSRVKSLIEAMIARSRRPQP